MKQMEFKEIPDALIDTLPKFEAYVCRLLLGFIYEGLNFDFKYYIHDDTAFIWCYNKRCKHTEIIEVYEYYSRLEDQNEVHDNLVELLTMLILYTDSSALPFL